MASWQGTVTMASVTMASDSAGPHRAASKSGADPGFCDGGLDVC